MFLFCNNCFLSDLESYVINEIEEEILDVSDEKSMGCMFLISCLVLLANRPFLSELNNDYEMQ
jgi:hypothetical protein